MAVAPVGKNPLSPRPWMIPDRSSPSRVRFAASRPGLLRADRGTAQIAAKISFKGDVPVAAAVKPWDRVFASQ